MPKYASDRLSTRKQVATQRTIGRQTYATGQGLGAPQVGESQATVLAKALSGLNGQLHNHFARQRAEKRKAEEANAIRDVVLGHEMPEVMSKDYYNAYQNASGDVQANDAIRDLNTRVANFDYSQFNSTEEADLAFTQMVDQFEVELLTKNNDPSFLQAVLPKVMNAKEQAMVESGKKVAAQLKEDRFTIVASQVDGLIDQNGKAYPLSSENFFALRNQYMSGGMKMSRDEASEAILQAAIRRAVDEGNPEHLAFAFDKDKDGVALSHTKQFGEKIRQAYKQARAQQKLNAKVDEEGDLKFSKERSDNREVEIMQTLYGAGHFNLEDMLADPDLNRAAKNRLRTQIIDVNQNGHYLTDASSYREFRERVFTDPEFEPLRHVGEGLSYKDALKLDEMKRNTKSPEGFITPIKRARDSLKTIFNPSNEMIPRKKKQVATQLNIANEYLNEELDTILTQYGEAIANPKHPDYAQAKMEVEKAKERAVKISTDENERFKVIEEKRQERIEFSISAYDEGTKGVIRAFHEAIQHLQTEPKTRKEKEEYAKILEEYKELKANLPSDYVNPFK